jgi:hypothetical protein
LVAGHHIVELGGDADMVAVLAHASLDDIADAELLADLLQMHRLALVGEGGVAGDDIEPAQLRQRCDDVLADAFGENSCSLSPEMLTKGRTAMAGRSSGG